jgi:hypothetical protein
LNDADVDSDAEHDLVILSRKANSKSGRRGRGNQGDEIWANS